MRPFAVDLIAPKANPARPRIIKANPLQFTRLRLLGFKSFVDPTELVIAPGLTGVVGPNGCGKSNLLEALRWVMGENRASAMRGDGMDDVIFAGAASRPARNYAEVMLAIDNSDHVAPLAFNEAEQIEVIRRITRDAGSAFRTNGKEARARDVQMLFADASTGAHSPSLVRQGQIAELINANPKARRRVLEEAAGISGLYQRRHEAELKLKATEVNLERVADVLEALDSQFRALERQAKQAARYREIADELRLAEGLLLYRRWREAETARENSVAALTLAVRAAGIAATTAASCTTVRFTAETRIPPLREEDAIAAALVQRLTLERAALNDQEARARQAIVSISRDLQQLVADRERETGLNRDATETIARLKGEAVSLEEAALGHETRLNAARLEATSAATALSEVEAALDAATGDAARLAARHNAASRRLDEAKVTSAKLEGELASALSAVAAGESDLSTAQDARDLSVTAEAEATLAAASAEKALALAEAARAEALAADYDTRSALSQVEGELRALEGERTALAKLIERDRGGKGQVLDQIRAQKGVEAALGAALGDDLKAPEIAPDGATGWVVSGQVTAGALPHGAEPLAKFVTGPAVLSPRLAQTGLVARTDGNRLQAQLSPGQRLVSIEGDLWRWDGFRVHAEDATSSAALRLQQMNQLAELEAVCGRVGHQTANARNAHATSKLRLENDQAAEQSARHLRRENDEKATLATRALSRAEADLGMLTGRLDTLRLTVARRREEMVLASDALRDAQAGLGDLGNLSAAQNSVEAHRIAVEAARLAMMTKRTMADELRREGEARVQRTGEIKRETANWAARRDSAGARLTQLDDRINAAATRLESAKDAPDAILAKQTELEKYSEKSETRRKAAADALAVAENALRGAENDERAAERAASETRESRARAEAVTEAALAQVKAAEEHMLAETELSPVQLQEKLAVDPASMPASEVIEIDVGRLRRQREALGAVNLRAEEDAREVGEEAERLRAEKADLEAAIAKLRQGISGLNREGRQRLLDAFEVVNKNFGQLFKTLFGGGEARLQLVESDDPLEAGLEIMCQPPGKKLSTLSLLSGGEQTLTALSLIFAVFKANPSPICVLDEVDAPLDDANVGRFCDLLDEMTRITQTRFLIITHHAVTMSRMDRLYGVTMAEKGVSQLVSVDLSRAVGMVA